MQGHSKHVSNKFEVVILQVVYEEQDLFSQFLIYKKIKNLIFKLHNKNLLAFTGCTVFECYIDLYGS